MPAPPNHKRHEGFFTERVSLLDAQRSVGESPTETTGSFVLPEKSLTIRVPAPDIPTGA